MKPWLAKLLPIQWFHLRAKPWLAKLLRTQWFYLLLVTVVLSVVTAWVNPLFLRVTNIESILKQISVLGLVATGATILIVSGNFDISVGAVIGLAGCVMGMLILAGVHVVWAVGAGVALSVACSLVVGGASILLRAPSFIVSLACIGIFKGISLALTKGTSQGVQEKIGMPGEALLFRGLPALFAISLGGFLVMHFVLTYTRLGRRVYAIGSNPRAAYLSGIGVWRNKLLFFAVSGLFVGVAAVLFLFRVGSAQPSTGEGLELQAIGAVVVGGAPMSGGKGKIIGTFFGVLLLGGIIPKVMGMLQVSANYTTLAVGVLIILALAASALSQGLRRRD